MILFKEEDDKMEDEILRARYRNLRSRVLQIRNRLSRLNSHHNKLINIMNDALLIDGKIVDEKNLEKINDGVNDIISEIYNSVIPSINGKT